MKSMLKRLLQAVAIVVVFVSGTNVYNAVHGEDAIDGNDPSSGGIEEPLESLCADPAVVKELGRLLAMQAGVATLTGGGNVRYETNGYETLHVWPGSKRSDCITTVTYYGNPGNPYHPSSTLQYSIQLRPDGSFIVSF